LTFPGVGKERPIYLPLSLSPPDLMTPKCLVPTSPTLSRHITLLSLPFLDTSYLLLLHFFFSNSFYYKLPFTFFI
jgi:hypothetical protein